MSNIGSRIRERRIAEKLTAKELSEKSKVPEKTIYRIETGEVQDPKISSVAPLAKSLKCTIDELVFGEDERSLAEHFKDSLYTVSSLNEATQNKILATINLMVCGSWMEKQIEDRMNQMVKEKNQGE